MGESSPLSLTRFDVFTVLPDPGMPLLLLLLVADKRASKNLLSVCVRGCVCVSACVL